MKEKRKRFVYFEMSTGFRPANGQNKEFCLVCMEIKCVQCTCTFVISNGFCPANGQNKEFCLVCMELKCVQ